MIQSETLLSLLFFLLELGTAVKYISFLMEELTTG